MSKLFRFTILAMLFIRIHSGDYPCHPSKSNEAVSWCFISGSTVSSAAFSGFQNVDKLKLLGGDDMQTIQPGAFDSMVQLTRLDLGFDFLKEIKRGVLNSLVGLKELKLDYNEITELPADLSLLKDLELLHINYNAITDIRPGTMDSLPNLKELALDHNNIKEIKRGVLNSLVNLKKLWLNNNSIRYIPKAAFLNVLKLEEIHLNNNLISYLREDCFQNLPNLIRLELHHNLLINLNFQVFNSINNLEILELSYNNLTVVSSGLLNISDTLKELYLENNKISSFSLDIGYFFYLHPNLKNISLNHNPWECSELQKARKALRRTNIQHVETMRVGTSINHLPYNIDRIACSNTTNHEKDPFPNRFKESRIFIINHYNQLDGNCSTILL